MDTLDLFSAINKALSQSEQCRRQEEIRQSLRSDQREMLIRGFFQHLIVDIPASYSPWKLLFLSISRDDIVCYEQLFELAANPTLIFSSGGSRGEGSITSFADFDSTVVIMQLTNELARAVAESPGHFHVVKLDSSCRMQYGTLRYMLHRILDQDVELLITDLICGELLADEQQDLQEVIRAVLTGYLMLAWPSSQSGFKTDRLTDLTARIRKTHRQYIESIRIALATDPIKLAVEAVNRQPVEEAIRLDSTLIGIRMALHRFSSLIDVAGVLVQEFPYSEAVVASKEFYQGYISSLKGSYERAKYLKQTISELSEARQVEFLAAGTLLESLRHAYDQLCTAGRATGIELEVLPGEGLLSKQVVAPAVLIDELFALQLDNCITAINSSKEAEKVIQVELVEGADLLYVAITNFAEKIPWERLVALQHGQIIRGTKGFGWGMLLSKQILREVGGQIRIDSPVRGKLGTRVTLGFRKVYNKANLTGGHYT